MAISDYDELKKTYLPAFLFAAIAFLAPNPIPAAMRRLKPPSIGHVGSSGSQPASGCAIVFMGLVIPANITIPSINIYFLYLFMGHLTFYKNNAFSLLIEHFKDCFNIIWISQLNIVITMSYFLIQFDAKYIISPGMIQCLSH